MLAQWYQNVHAATSESWMLGPKSMENPLRRLLANPNSNVII
jgi:hypothetical protein